jgi:hypothetical protein
MPTAAGTIHSTGLTAAPAPWRARAAAWHRTARGGPVPDGRHRGDPILR